MEIMGKVIIYPYDTKLSLALIDLTDRLLPNKIFEFVIEKDAYEVVPILYKRMSYERPIQYHFVM